MPNMFGGDSSHPAYAPWMYEGKNDPRMELVGQTEYRIVGSGDTMEVHTEELDGRGHRYSADSQHLPEAVKTKIAALREKEQEIEVRKKDVVHGC